MKAILKKTKKVTAVLLVVVMLVGVMVVPTSALTVSNSARGIITVQFDSNSCPQIILSPPLGAMRIGSFGITMSGTITRIEVIPLTPVSTGVPFVPQNFSFTRRTSTGSSTVTTSASSIANNGGVWSITNFNGLSVTADYSISFSGVFDPFIPGPGSYAFPNMMIRIYTQ